MSQLERLRARLSQSRTLTLTHPLDDTVRMTHRTPTPDEREAAIKASRAGNLQEANAGLLADTLIGIAEEDVQIATRYGMDLYGALGHEWEQGTSTAVDVVRAFYGEAYAAIEDHAVRVIRLAKGGPADPLD